MAVAAYAPPRAVLFDLDGTLVDTVADISLALNHALAEFGLPPLDTAVIRTLIGRGAPTLMMRALARLGAAATQPDAARLLERFELHYQRIQAGDELTAQVYAGVPEGLAALHAQRIALAVVTNKPTGAACELLSRLGLMRWLSAVVGSDAGLPLKPDPQPLWRACQQLGVDPSHALMVGDSVNDVLAARAAGMRVVCVPYGYNEGADPRTLPCDEFVESLDRLPALLAAQVTGQPPPYTRSG